MPPTPGLMLVKNGELTKFDESWFPKQEKKPLPPVEFIGDIREQAGKAERYIGRISAVEGVRDNTAFKVSCILCQKFSLPEAVAFPILKRWAAHNCDPAFDDDEKRLIHKIREAIKLRH